MRVEGGHANDADFGLLLLHNNQLNEDEGYREVEWPQNTDVGRLHIIQWQWLSDKVKGLLMDTDVGQTIDWESRQLAVSVYARTDNCDGTQSKPTLNRKSNDAIVQFREVRTTIFNVGVRDEAVVCCGAANCFHYTVNDANKL